MAIIFDRGDHPNHMPHSGHFLLVVIVIVGKVCLTKVLMDGRSTLNILYVEILNKMKIPRNSLYPSGASFFGVVPGKEAMPLACIWLHVTFGMPDNDL